MDSIDITCALTERQFRFSWPEGVEPISWLELTVAIEDSVGGTFHARQRGPKPGQYESVLQITSQRPNQEIIDEVGEIIRKHLPPELRQQIRMVFWGQVDKNKNWRQPTPDSAP